MRKFGLIGYPLGHSFSKKYFADKFHNEHITDCVYENYSLDNLGKLQRLIAGDPELFGLNVTIPYKSAVIKLLDVVSPEAEEIGSVNVIKIKRTEGKFKLHGFNSDITGIRDSLLPFFTGKRDNAIVLGTGGSSRSVCYVLKKMGFNVTLVSRTKNPGVITYTEIDERLISKTSLIINTTPLGMYPDSESKPDLNYSLLGRKHLLFDLVYNPELTSFLKMGMKQGCITMNGLGMLHSQAEKAWNIWNDDEL